MIAMLLSAGRGERLRPITDTTPKPLVEVRGRPLIDYHLERVRQAGITDIVINLGWLGDEILEHVGSGERFGVNVVYSPEGENILETGGGIHRALPMLGSEPFVVINADIFTDMPLPGGGLDDGDLGHLVLVPRPAFRDHGDFSLQGSRVSNKEPRDLTFSGVAIYRPEFFADCEPGRFPLAPMLRAAADERRLSGSVYGGIWQDVGTVDRFNALNNL